MVRLDSPAEPSIHFVKRGSRKVILLTSQGTLTILKFSIEFCAIISYFTHFIKDQVLFSLEKHANVSITYTPGHCYIKHEDKGSIRFSNIEK